MKSRNIMADIISILKDGKFHTTSEIASEVDVCTRTVKRHIESLSYRFNISTFRGGVKKGGIKLIVEKSISIEGVTNNELQLIISTLDSLQESTMGIKTFSNRLKIHLKIREKDENYTKEIE